MPNLKAGGPVSPGPYGYCTYACLTRLTQYPLMSGLRDSAALMCGLCCARQSTYHVWVP